MASSFLLAAVVVARLGLPRLPRLESFPPVLEGVFFGIDESLWLVEAIDDDVGVAWELKFKLQHEKRDHKIK